MATAETIAKILGPLYVIVALGMVANAPLYQRVSEAFLEQPAVTYLGGLLALAAGLAILAVHPGWHGDWTAIITLIGWLALIKGALLMVRPGWVMQWSRRMMAEPGRLRVMAVVPLVLGLFLAAKGYGVA